MNKSVDLSINETNGVYPSLAGIISYDDDKGSEQCHQWEQFSGFVHPKAGRIDVSCSVNKGVDPIRSILHSSPVVDRQAGRVGVERIYAEWQIFLPALA